MAVTLPPRALFPARHFSPLKPHISRSTSIKCSGATTTSTKIHLANLDRVLLKPSTLLPLQQPVSPIHLQHNDRVSPSSDRRMSMASVFPDLFRKVAAEDMISPGSLKRLHRLLSDSARPSPRSCIADTWRELHGAKGWSGLLDPLDEHLRRELVRYGELVQAAYHAFHSIPSPRSSSSRHRHLILPDRSYRPTKSLFASSSLDLPQWAPHSLAERSSWIGYVAVCDCDREIRRMGRRDIAIVLRGTATCIEWAENLRPSLVPLDPVQSCLRGASKVAQGFLSLFQTAGEHVPSLAEGVIQEVRRLMKVYEGEELSITITGHSLGAALAVLVADELSEKLGSAVPSIAVISFGGPKVGNGAFAERVKRRGLNVLRVVNSGDVITRVPAAPALPHVSEGYEHVGSELRVDNRNSPYLKPGAGPDCCHDLEAYLHLVDGFSKSGFGFRPDAKRSLVRLLELQQPNVKKVYARQAQIIRSNRVKISLPERPTEPCRVHSVNSVEPDRLILTNIKISR